MFDDFVAQKDEDRYKWAARLKRFLSKQPEYKAEYNHKLFVAIIEFHIEQLQRERDLLKKILTQYEDRKLDGISFQPERYLKKSYDVTETIANRIRELDGYIVEYEIDLKKRRIGQVFYNASRSFPTIPLRHQVD